jgi:hypothetical protein
MSTWPVTRKVPDLQGLSSRVSDRIRTGDRLDHNQELYQLSYAHHGALESTSAGLSRLSG